MAKPKTRMLKSRANELDGLSSTDSLGGYVNRARILEEAGEYRNAAGMYRIAAEHTLSPEQFKNLLQESERCRLTIKKES